MAEGHELRYHVVTKCIGLMTKQELDTKSVEMNYFAWRKGDV